MLWALLAYALLSPLLGLLVGAAIRMRDEVDVHPVVEETVEPAACPTCRRAYHHVRETVLVKVPQSVYTKSIQQTTRVQRQGQAQQ